MEKTYVGIDIGGTTIKGILGDAEGNILKEDEVDTGVADGNEAVCRNVCKLINYLACDTDRADVGGVGIGCPGMIDSAKGLVVFAGNLNLSEYPLAGRVSKAVRLPVTIANDAHTAALGEATFGAGKEYRDVILVTLGTGVGGGIILDGKLFEGNGSVGTEIGHTVIDRYGLMCTCGRRGCFERYASATALIRMTRKAMEENPGSAMWETYTAETCTPKTAFEYAERDVAASEVLDEYTTALAVGLANLANVFRPQVIMIGGGVSGQGDRLIVPVRKKFEAQLFGGLKYAPVEIVKASLGNKAGSLGAVALAMRAERDEGGKA